MLIEKVSGIAKLRSMRKLAHLASMSYYPKKVTQKGVLRRFPNNFVFVASSFNAPVPPPFQWFVCDDVCKKVRHIVIQGSYDMDHWKLNLSFDPVPLKEHPLGNQMRVHRGTLHAARRMLKDLTPYIQQHLRTDGTTIDFIGHSAGGAVATILLMLCILHHVASPYQVGKALTIGAPAILSHDHTPSDVLSSLGLHTSSVHNIIMSRDIVPRAFSCDYSIISKLLKRWIRDHKNLEADKFKHLYDMVGEMYVIQPDPIHAFCKGDPFHAMLPQEAGLFHIQADSPEEWFYDFMNDPHPIHLIRQKGAYAKIQRYHNADHYASALSRIVFLESSSHP